MLNGQRRRLTAQLLCVVVVIFLAHFHLGCSQGVSHDPRPALSATDGSPHSSRHDPRTCPVYRALQTLSGSNPTVVRAPMPLKGAQMLVLTKAGVPAAHAPIPTCARGPPSPPI